MLFIGLPHGAVDHRIYIEKTVRPTSDKIGMMAFLTSYLAMILFYGFAWYFLPTLSLLVFILLSCYHFGQSQLYYFFSNQSVVIRLLYGCWGLSVLSFIICWNWAESVALLTPIVPALAPTFASERVVNVMPYLPLLITTIPTVFLLSRLSYSKYRSAVLWELFSLAIIGLASYWGGLIVGFSVYFGLWHSTKSLRSIIRSFKQNRPSYSLSHFYREALPFSIISIFGIVLMLVLSQYLTALIHPVMLFFILISLLTLPHMVVLERIYTPRLIT